VRRLIRYGGGGSPLLLTLVDGCAMVEAVTFHLKKNKKNHLGRSRPVMCYIVEHRLRANKQRTVTDVFACNLEVEPFLFQTLERYDISIIKENYIRKQVITKTTGHRVTFQAKFVQDGARLTHQLLKTAKASAGGGSMTQKYLYSGRSPDPHVLKESLSRQHHSPKVS